VKSLPKEQSNINKIKQRSIYQLKIEIQLPKSFTYPTSICSPYKIKTNSVEDH
jgi:hypothetical protein